MENQKTIQKYGIEKYMEKQNIRINILRKILSEYNDGKSKNYFCIAVALLDINCLNDSIKKVESKIKNENIMENDLRNKANILKNILSECAEKNNIEIKLQR